MHHICTHCFKRLPVEASCVGGLSSLAHWAAAAETAGTGSLDWGGGGGEGGLEASDNDNTSFQHKNKTQPRKGELLFERSAHISQRCAPDFQGGSCSSSALSSGFLIRASSGIYSGGGGTQGTTPSDPECHCSKWAFDHEHVTLGPAAAPGSQESRDILGLTGFFRMRHHATSASAISLPGL